jgi:transcriptional regulator with XRE-family HTH domain
VPIAYQYRKAPLEAKSIRPKARTDRIVLARVQAGLTQEELATKAGCSVFSIGKIERGSRSPSGPLLRRIARATGKPISWFFGDDDGEAPS